MFSIGVWSKVDLHLNGNIVGYQRVTAPKRLMVFGASNLYRAVAEYSSDAFHEKFLLPLYDWCLKGQQTSYVDEPNIRYIVPGERTAETWPPRDVVYTSYYLKNDSTGSVTTLNDGSLEPKAPGADGGHTIFDYPNPDWTDGVVGRVAQGGGWDPVRRVNTFTTAPLAEPLEIAGPVKLVMYASSSNHDTDFVIKLSEQMPQSDDDHKKGIQPLSTVVTKGWLLASHRQIDTEVSLENAPWYTYDAPMPLEPGKVYKFEIAIMPTAYKFKKGSRIRLEIANGDSPVTEGIFPHLYTPDKIGRDVYEHNAQYPSALILTLIKAQN